MRNNMIYASLLHDTVVEMVHVDGWLVAHNTALLLNPSEGLPWGMEVRFDDTEGTFAYNLTNMPIRADRDGAQSITIGNWTSADPGWFADAPTDDLHLASSGVPPVDQAASFCGVVDDFNGNFRPKALPRMWALMNGLCQVRGFATGCR